MRDDHGVLSFSDFPEGHCNILEIVRSQMWILQRTCDKNEGRRRGAKPGYTNELVRFTARTPCWQATVWGITMSDTAEAPKRNDRITKRRNCHCGACFFQHGDPHETLHFTMGKLLLIVRDY